MPLLFCTRQAKSHPGYLISPRNSLFGGWGEGVFCLVTDWRAQCWNCCSTWWQWRFARGNAGVTPRHTGSLNLWEQQRETLRRGSGGVGGVGGLQHPQLPLPPSLVPPTLTDLGLFIQFAAHRSPSAIRFGLVAKEESILGR